MRAAGASDSVPVSVSGSVDTAIMGGVRVQNAARPFGQIVVL